MAMQEHQGEDRTDESSDSHREKSIPSQRVSIPGIRAQCGDLQGNDEIALSCQKSFQSMSSIFGKCWLLSRMKGVISSREDQSYCTCNDENGLNDVRDENLEYC